MIRYLLRRTVRFAYRRVTRFASYSTLAGASVAVKWEEWQQVITGFIGG